MKEAVKLADKIKEIPQKYYRMIAAVLACSLFAVTVGAVSSTTVEVEVRDRGQVETHYVTTQEKEEILELTGYADETEIETELSEFVDGKAVLTVYRPFTATIVDGDQTMTCRVLHTTVEETLAQAGITLGEYDQVNVDLDAYATVDPIVINRISYATVQEMEEIPYETTQQETSTMTLGSTRVVQAGQTGEKTYTYQVRYENGQEVERVLTGEEVTRQPVNETVLVGTTPVVARTGAISELPCSVQLDGNGVPVSYRDVWSGLSAVAYYAESGAGTASGLMRCVPGVVAVNPDVIPYGTKMYIIASDGTVYGYAIAADTGASVRNGVVDLDLFMNTVSDCYSWGRKSVTVYFL